MKTTNHRLKRLSKCISENDLLHRILHEYESPEGIVFERRIEEGMIVVSVDKNAYGE
ncbi:MAG: hypothetical protein V4606_02090 [Patescibacteria group bacterium]